MLTKLFRRLAVAVLSALPLTALAASNPNHTTPSHEHTVAPHEHTLTVHDRSQTTRH